MFFDVFQLERVTQQYLSPRVYKTIHFPVARITLHTDGSRNYW